MFVEIFRKLNKLNTNIFINEKLGECYQLSYKYFNSYDKNIKLVHGLVHGQGALTGIVYNHAWVEDGNTVIDKTLPPKLQKLDKKVYYALGKIETVFKYSHDEVNKKSIEYETYGPWEKVLLKNKY